MVLPFFFNSNKTERKLKVESAVVVTQDFHLPRVLYINEKRFQKLTGYC